MAHVPPPQCVPKELSVWAAPIPLDGDVSFIPSALDGVPPICPRPYIILCSSGALLDTTAMVASIRCSGSSSQAKVENLDRFASSPSHLCVVRRDVLVVATAFRTLRVGAIERTLRRHGKAGVPKVASARDHHSSMPSGTHWACVVGSSSLSPKTES